MPTLIGATEFAEQFRTFRKWAWRLQAYSSYGLAREAPELQRFLAGEPTPPPQVPWWNEWLCQIRDLTSDGKEIRRTILDDDPLSDYQRLQRWGEPWHAEAGELMTHIPRAVALTIGLPSYDFWLFDGQRLILMLYNAAGEPSGRVLIEREEDPQMVAQHVAWRNLAIQHATPAAERAAMT